MSAPLLERRAFLRVSAALGGGLLVSFRWPESRRESRAAPAPSAGQGARAELVPNAFVRIAPDGRVTVIVNKAEMGQGVCTSLAMLLAEELDADWERVGFEFAPVDPVYAHPGFGIQMTGGSTSVAGMSGPMRQAGAAARAVLVEAAARGWGVPAAECRTESGSVRHDASARAASYGELVDAAARIPAPAEVALKDPADFRLIGKPTRRLDTPDKLHGRAIFSIDVALPGMLTALVAHPPVFGGRAKRVQSDAARAVPGVKQVVDVGSGVAVIATGFWAAKRGRDLLKVDWDLGPNAKLSSDALASRPPTVGAPRRWKNGPETTRAR
jgi:isoquinoline 1-oxidoreductase beta subunit